MMLFIGWALVLLDVQITLGNIAPELLPDAIGYILIFRALTQRQDALGRLRLWMPVMAVFSAGVYLAGFWELTVRQELILWVLESVRLGLGLWLLRRTVVLPESQRAERLKTLWGFLVAVRVAVQLLSWLPLVGSVIPVAGVVMGICFLVGLYPTLTPAKE